MRKVSLLIVITLIISGAAFAERYPDMGLKKIGLRVGPAVPDSPYKVGFAFGLSADLGKLHQIIGVEGNVEYMRVTKTVSEIFTYSHSDIGIIVTGKIIPEVRELPFQPYLGGGLGVHFLSDKPDPNSSEQPESETRLELHIAAGATMPITDTIDGTFTFKVNLSDISTYNPYLGVLFKL
ncbi:hypothetical protein DRQ36_10305 [bacterium]|nr:MAG: hypothetical protein DRQ36_10305 [bacterium]